MDLEQRKRWDDAQNRWCFRLFVGIIIASAVGFASSADGVASLLGLLFVGALSGLAVGFYVSLFGLLISSGVMRLFGWMPPDDSPTSYSFPLPGRGRNKPRPSPHAPARSDDGISATQQPPKLVVYPQSQVPPTPINGPPPLPIDIPQCIPEPAQPSTGKVGREGWLEEGISYRRVRDSRMREEAIRIHGRSCAVCGFDFDRFYGSDVSQGYIEVHHLHPLWWGERETNPATDLFPLCANCHAMADKMAREIFDYSETIAELRAKLLPGLRKRA